MSLAPGFSVSQAEWIAVLTWREENMHLSERAVRDHFAHPDNGALQFSMSALGRRWKQWKELREACADGEQPAFELHGHRALKDAEWVQVFAFVDAHPDYSRDRVTKHFKSQGFQFQKSTLAQKLRRRDVIEQSVAEVGGSKGKGKAKMPTEGRAVGSRSSARSTQTAARPRRAHPALQTVPSGDASDVVDVADDSKDSATAEEVAPAALHTRESSLTPLRDTTPPHREAPNLIGQENDDPVLLDLSNSASVLVTLSERVKTYRRGRGRGAPYQISAPTLGRKGGRSTSASTTPEPTSASSSAYTRPRKKPSSQRDLAAESKRLVLRSQLWDNWLP